MRILVLPGSNAEVERLFSQMNVVKSKLRNQMRPKLLDAILSTRAGLKRNSVCCSEYNLPKSVLKHIGSTAIYSSQAELCKLVINDNNTEHPESENDTEDIILF
ncbi:unnamed protein product [Macrosiphum euphorbiae]|uniref:HAT C-terminal dimerisation domain-containing protein n=1 Tax=Macrosiphum euphorbiae TaxID=13131 RepID=A0AAV0XPI8_9HEMI|nr:unnamed protein product [Macrosiphum euphorbiae]